MDNLSLKYKIYIFLTICLTITLSNGLINKKEILTRHNYYRSIVKPAATNMNILFWNATLAKNAQKLANKCLGLKHEKNFNEGQNIFISKYKKYANKYAIDLWASEKIIFKYGDTNPYYNDTLHYTQIIWAKTHSVGCGYKKCSNNTYIFICNYYPTGNVRKISKPYKSV